MPEFGHRMECRQCGQEWCCIDPDNTSCRACGASDARLLGVESERGLALYAPAANSALAQENAELRAEVAAQQTEIERLKAGWERRQSEQEKLDREHFAEIERPNGVEHTLVLGAVAALLATRCTR